MKADMHLVIVIDEKVLAVRRRGIMECLDFSLLFEGDEVGGVSSGMSMIGGQNRRSSSMEAIEAPSYNSVTAF